MKNYDCNRFVNDITTITFLALLWGVILWRYYWQFKPFTPIGKCIYLHVCIAIQILDVSN